MQITQDRDFGWNSQERLDLAELRSDQISLVIWISIWIRDEIEEFFTIDS